MHLAQGKLFWNMDIEFVKKVTDLAVTIQCKDGEMIFNVGDPADNLYVLLKGSVIMERGQDKWYTAKHPGEIFGWSALIHREVYEASATSGIDTELLKIERKPFLDLLEQSPENKAILFEHFAKMLGDQLLETYLSISC
jgi:CRP-like cAMP-binding protein